MKPNMEKRKLKSEPRLNIQLNDEQKKVKTLFYEHDVNFIHGDFGSGKTLVACAIALSAFRKKEYNHIIIARPAVKNSVGFLPGDIKDKLEPLVAPIVHNFNMCQSANTTDKMLADNQIQILPVDFAKGITYVNSVVIVDEYQDLDYEDFRMMLSRLGINSKLIFCGSKEQIHRSIGKSSCIFDTIKLEESKLVAYSTLKSNHRNPAITNIIKYLENEK